MARNVVSGESIGNFLGRSMRGTTFLGLEHAMHVVFIVVVSALIAAGLMVGVQLWSGQQTNELTSMFLGIPSEFAVATSALAIAAGLVVLSPFLVILDLRTRSELVKRKGFEQRTAYKAPLYVGLAVLWAVKLTAIVTLVSVLLYSLAGINRMPADAFVAMYEAQFLPALITLLVFAVAGWYVIRWSQGRDWGKQFNLAWLAFALAVAVALFVAAATTFQNPNISSEVPAPAAAQYYNLFN